MTSGKSSLTILAIKCVGTGTFSNGTGHTDPVRRTGTPASSLIKIQVNQEKSENKMMKNGGKYLQTLLSKDM